MIMTRGANKKAFAIDDQRGEGAAQRESLLRGGPLEMDETEVATPDNVQNVGASQNLVDLQRMASSGGAFAPSNNNRPIIETVPNEMNYEAVEPGQASNTNMILAAINDLLGGSEEASSMIG